MNVTEKPEQARYKNTKAYNCILQICVMNHVQLFISAANKWHLTELAKTVYVRR